MPPFIGNNPNYTDPVANEETAIGNAWEIPLEFIVREYQLGEGTFGKVAKGFIRGPIPGTYTMKNRLHATVAIKFLKGI